MPTAAAGPYLRPSRPLAITQHARTLSSLSPADKWPRSLISLSASAPAPAAVTVANGIQAAPVSNQSADAVVAIIAAISLYGSDLIPFNSAQQQALTTALKATVTASTNMQLTSVEVLSVSEYTPTNTTSSPSPSRRLLVKHPGNLQVVLACKHIQSHCC